MRYSEIRWCQTKFTVANYCDEMETFRFESCVRGHHIYKNIWNPLGEELTCCREVENTQDPFAVAVKQIR